MSQQQTFGSWLRQRRTELGVTRDVLSDHLGFSLDTLRKLESGERRPSGQIAHLLADYFRIPPDEREAFVTFARTGQVSLSDGKATPATATESSRTPWRRAYTSQTNLPAMLTSLIGRERETEAVCEQILHPRTRLLTLTGPPGIGKTRLALQVATDLVNHFDDGVYFVDLSPIHDPDQVLPTAARTLDLTESGDRTLTDALIEHTRDKRILLLLDNFEQVLDATPDVVRLLQVGPWLKVLATSRETLHVRGERRYSIPPLVLPDLAQLPPLDVLAGYPSVQLFIERAQEVAPWFALEQANAGDVAALCVELEGLPLSIELAAARANHLSPREMRSALDDRFKLLATGGRDLPRRQRTLRNAIEWSYDLLGKEEQRLFNHLGVFARGFTRQAVEAVSSGVAARPANRKSDAAPEYLVLDILESLVEKNLVRVDHLESGEGETLPTRYAMLETIRDFALERLEASGEALSVREQHARYCFALAEEVGPLLGGSRQKASLERLESEHANIRLAFEFLLDEGKHDEQLLEMAMRLGNALGIFWYMHGYTTEGRRWLETSIEQQDSWLARDGRNREEQPGTTDWLGARIGATSALALMLYMEGNLQGAQHYYAESLALSKQAGDKLRAARALNNLGMVATVQGDLDTARHYYEEALSNAQALGQPEGITRILNNLGVVAHKQGDYEGARRYYEESLEIRRPLGDKQGEASTLCNLGGIATIMGDLSEGYSIFSQALEMGRELGDKFTIVRASLGLGDVALGNRDYEAGRSHYKEGLRIAREIDTKQVVLEALDGLAQAAALATPAEPATAAKLLGMADAGREAIGAPRTVREQAQIDAALAGCRATLGDALWEEAWTEGRGRTIDQAIDYALGET